MGGLDALKFGGLGFLADNILGTGPLGTLAGAVFGALFKPDAGQMNQAYDKGRATVGQTLKDFFGYEMSGDLFGSGKNPADMLPNRKRAQQNAEAREKKDGLPWGKILLGGGAALLGINLLENMFSGPFSMGCYAPFGMWGGGGGPGLLSALAGPTGMFGPNMWGGGGGLLQMGLAQMLGFGPYNFLC